MVPNEAAAGRMLAPPLVVRVVCVWVQLDCTWDTCSTCIVDSAPVVDTIPLSKSTPDTLPVTRTWPVGARA